MIESSNLTTPRSLSLEYLQAEYEKQKQWTLLLQKVYTTQTACSQQYFSRLSTECSPTSTINSPFLSYQEYLCKKEVTSISYETFLQMGEETKELNKKIENYFLRTLEKADRTWAKFEETLPRAELPHFNSLLEDESVRSSLFKAISYVKSIAKVPFGPINAELRLEKLKFYGKQFRRELREERNVIIESLENDRWLDSKIFFSGENRLTFVLNEIQDASITNQLKAVSLGWDRKAFLFITHVWLEAKCLLFHYAQFILQKEFCRILKESHLCHRLAPNVDSKYFMPPRISIENGRYPSDLNKTEILGISFNPGMQELWRRKEELVSDITQFGARYNPSESIPIHSLFRGSVPLGSCSLQNWRDLMAQMSKLKQSEAPRLFINFVLSDLENLFERYHFELLLYSISDTSDRKDGITKLLEVLSEAPQDEYGNIMTSLPLTFDRWGSNGPPHGSFYVSRWDIDVLDSSIGFIVQYCAFLYHQKSEEDKDLFGVNRLPETGIFIRLKESESVPEKVFTIRGIYTLRAVFSPENEGGCLIREDKLDSVWRHLPQFEKGQSRVDLSSYREFEDLENRLEACPKSSLIWYQLQKNHSISLVCPLRDLFVFDTQTGFESLIQLLLESPDFTQEVNDQLVNQGRNHRNQCSFMSMVQKYREGPLDVRPVDLYKIWKQKIPPESSLLGKFEMLLEELQISMEEGLPSVKIFELGPRFQRGDRSLSNLQKIEVDGSFYCLRGFVTPDKVYVRGPLRRFHTLKNCKDILIPLKEIRKVLIDSSKGILLYDKTHFEAREIPYLTSNVITKIFIESKFNQTFFSRLFSFCLSSLNRMINYFILRNVQVGGQ